MGKYFAGANTLRFGFFRQGTAISSGPCFACPHNILPTLAVLLIGLFVPRLDAQLQPPRGVASGQVQAVSNGVLTIVTDAPTCNLPKETKVDFVLGPETMVFGPRGKVAVSEIQGFQRATVQYNLQGNRRHPVHIRLFEPIQAASTQPQTPSPGSGPKEQVGPAGSSPATQKDLSPHPTLQEFESLDIVFRDPIQAYAFPAGGIPVTFDPRPEMFDLIAADQQAESFDLGLREMVRRGASEGEIRAALGKVARWSGQVSRLREQYYSVGPQACDALATRESSNVHVLARCARRWTTELEKERDTVIVKLHPAIRSTTFGQAHIDPTSGEWMLFSLTGGRPGGLKSAAFPNAKADVERALAAGPNDAEALVAALLRRVRFLSLRLFRPPYWGKRFADIAPTLQMWRTTGWKRVAPKACYSGHGWRLPSFAPDRRWLALTFAVRLRLAWILSPSAPERFYLQSSKTRPNVARQNPLRTSIS